MILKKVDYQNIDRLLKDGPGLSFDNIDEMTELIDAYHAYQRVMAIKNLYRWACRLHRLMFMPVSTLGDLNLTRQFNPRIGSRMNWLFNFRERQSISRMCGHDMHVKAILSEYHRWSDPLQMRSEYRNPNDGSVGVSSETAIRCHHREFIESMVMSKGKLP